MSADEFSDCWGIGFAKNEGAYMETNGLHLSNGLILPLASDFNLAGPTVKDPFPLRHGDTICLNEKGKVRKATIWVGN